jgi:hypothetical protein
MVNFQKHQKLKLKVAEIHSWTKRLFEVLPSRAGSELTSKYYTKLERLARDKRSSLFGLFVIDEEEKELHYVDTW